MDEQDNWTGGNPGYWDIQPPLVPWGRLVLFAAFVAAMAVAVLTA